MLVNQNLLINVSEFLPGVMQGNFQQPLLLSESASLSIQEMPAESSTRDAAVGQEETQSVLGEL